MVRTFTKRLTSPLVYEPLYIPPEEVLYPGSDDEATPYEREQKRRRVEIQGQQYLNGRPLFIQSAALKGPFDKEWVNPWRSKKRKIGVNDIGHFPEVGTEAFSRHSEAGLSTAKRRSVAVSGYGSLDYGPNKGALLATKAYGQEQPTAKPRGHGELDEPHGYHGSQTNVDQGVAASNSNRRQWLKTDRAYPQARLREDTPSSTPTPATKTRSKSHASSSPHPEQLVRAITVPPGINYQKRLSRSNEHTLNIGNASKSTTSVASEGTHIENIELAATDLRPGQINLVDKVLSDDRKRGLTKTDIITRHGYAEVKRDSQRAVKRAENEDGQLQVRKKSQEAVARAIEGEQTKASSRLTPYVSEAVIGNDAASSAALRAVKAPKPAPSPHTVPPSTYQPEFQYRYSRKETSTSASPQRALFVDAPEQPQARPRSGSSSSSGSSAFAEALEAAQEKAASKSFASSNSSSPATEGPETKSVKKNRQALRRLTFTPLGGAKVVSTRTSSRPCSSSSAADAGKMELKVQDQLHSNDPPSLLRTSTKSSARSLTNGNRSRNSIMFPEAQIDPIAHPALAQAPSEPSTNLLETDKQSPKVPSFDEGDSYFDLSTQAAVMKAQRSFQADVISTLTPRRLKKEESSPISSRKVDVTPMLHGRRGTEAANAQLTKPPDGDGKEPMSTQAMVDAISPFAITTIKKRPPAVQKRTSVNISPTKKSKARSPPQAAILFPESPTTAIFRTHSPGMSTSPSPTPSPSPEKSPPPIPLSHPTPNSKPPSSLMSFSILPNGTLTETSLYQHDGQQQRDIPDYDISLPLDPFGFDGGGGDDGQGQGRTWDLNEAIEGAGSFLGDWDVEAEARKEGRLSRKRESGNRSILKGGA